MAILNPGFEEPGEHPGEAAHWTLITFVASERIAWFGPKPHRAFEDFERWIEFRDSFNDGDLGIAFFDPLPEGSEDFDESWSNDFYLFELPTGHVVLCPFSGGAAEDMEDGWLSTPFAWDLDEVTIATGVFDGETQEDFEDVWRSNENYAWHLADVSTDTATFDGGSVEGFEGPWTFASTI
jgi:hypothetical protein